MNTIHITVGLVLTLVTVATGADGEIRDGHGLQGQAHSRAHGTEVYARHCAPCHDSGLEGAPALDDVPAWAVRSPEWDAVLKQHAMDGFLGMPAKGASPTLSERDISLAVDHMVARIRPPSLLAAGGAQGRLVYQTTCARCHSGGVNDAPVIGDARAWAVRSVNWHTVLEQHANDGFLSMPGKGGELQLFREDIAAAVAFMIAWSRR